MRRRWSDCKKHSAGKPLPQTMWWRCTIKENLEIKKKKQLLTKIVQSKFILIFQDIKSYGERGDLW